MIQKGGLWPSFKVTVSNDRVLCIYAPSGDSTREQLARGSFFEGLQNYMENKNKGNENKIIFGDFQCTMDKMERNDENKADFRYAVSIMPWQNSLWIMNSMIYGEGRTQIPLSSPVTIDLLAQDTRVDRIYTDIKAASNTKINHIVVSFTDHYNAIFIDRFSSQTKIGKDSWYFNNFPLCKPEFSSTTNTFLF